MENDGTTRVESILGSTGFPSQKVPRVPLREPLASACCSSCIACAALVNAVTVFNGTAVFVLSSKTPFTSHGPAPVMLKYRMCSVLTTRKSSLAVKNICLVPFPSVARRVSGDSIDRAVFFDAVEHVHPASRSGHDSWWWFPFHNLGQLLGCVGIFERGTVSHSAV